MLADGQMDKTQHRAKLQALVFMFFLCGLCYNTVARLLHQMIGLQMNWKRFVRKWSQPYQDTILVFAGRTEENSKKPQSLFYMPLVTEERS
jgi:hypothetical protein